jgi:hypothetical protein
VRGPKDDIDHCRFPFVASGNHAIHLPRRLIATMITAIVSPSIMPSTAQIAKLTSNGCLDMAEKSGRLLQGNRSLAGICLGKSGQIAERSRVRAPA